MRQQEREFTVADFSRLCNRRTRGRIYDVPYQTCQPFLDRCAENGLLTKHMDGQVARYSPTQLLRLLTPGGDE